MASTKTGGGAIVQALLDHGVEAVFGLPGVQTYPIFDALAQNAGRIRTFSARHEQATAYMAFGYAQATGRTGVFSVVPGPGVMNTMAALSTAWGCNIPILCITGQVPRAFLEAGRGHLHEIPDQIGAVSRFCKYAARIENPGDAPRIVSEAFAAMWSGRPGPGFIEMCWDDLAAEGPVTPAPLLDPDPAPSIDPDELEHAADLIRASERPMIFVGGGARHAGAQVRAFAEQLGAPVAAFRSGRGVVPADHPLATPYYAAWKMWDETDLAIGVGSRLEMPFMRWSGMGRRVSRPDNPKLIRIDIDPAEMGRLTPHAALVADAAEGVAALSRALEGAQAKPMSDAIAKAKTEAHQAIAEVQPQVGYLDAIRRALPREGLFVEELTQTGYASYFAWDVFAPSTYITSGFQGNLGYGFMTALGAKVGRPDRPVVAITGDGGFLYGASELATAKKEGIGLVTILFNNNAYGNVKRDQGRLFDGRVLATDFENPDFEALAGAYGVAYARAENAAQLEAAVAAAINEGDPALIEVPVALENEADPWPFILKMK